jgi:hypothetical protein
MLFLVDRETLTVSDLEKVPTKGRITRKAVRNPIVYGKTG